MEDAIRAFVTERFKATVGNTAIGPDTPLFSSGIVDSFGVLELIAFLEDTFHIQIDPARHELSEFDSAAKIAGLVTRLSPKRP
jgi:acyl carrier protein